MANSAPSSVGMTPASRLQARPTSRDLVAQQLREAILKEELAEGQKLSVPEIAEFHGVSHTPAREALQLLAGEDFVRINAYRGAYVAELSADDYQEIMLMRIPLEGLAAELGADRITDDGIRTMKHRLEELTAAAESSDLEQFIEVDREFHAAHYLASGRESLWERIIGLRFTAERYTRRGYQLQGIMMGDTAERHANLFAAVEAHDSSRAKEVLTNDLRRTFETLYADLRQRESNRAPVEVPVK
jgi:DNA-binding GntR family transcriptional regulator